MLKANSNYHLPKSGRIYLLRALQAPLSSAKLRQKALKKALFWAFLLKIAWKDETYFLSYFDRPFS
jgi:hypothetical protein